MSEDWAKPHERENEVFEISGFEAIGRVKEKRTDEDIDCMWF